MTGKTILHYDIVEKLGEGGMGIVYKAHDTKLKRDVAIKFLPKHLSSHSAEQERFLQEAQSASSLNHPNICVIHSIDQTEDETFIVMEYIEGETLRTWMETLRNKTGGSRPHDIQEKLGIAVQVADGLEKAHEKGIIHRDVKAENIMVTPDGRAKVMDFGLAKLRGVSKLTQTGSTVGTMAYMSPEQVEGIETDHRSDIFSFGVVLYELLTGKLPFHAEHQAAVMYEILNVDPVPLSEVNSVIGSELDRIVQKCLEKNRDERYQSMREIAVDLKRYRRDSEGRKIDRSAARMKPISGGKTVRRQMPYRIGVIGLLLVLVALLAYLVLNPSRDEGMQNKVITKITSGPGLENNATWSPDGQFIAYETDDRGNLDIVVQPLAGGEQIRIVSTDADDAQPAWSPDGSKIAFVSARDHGGHLSISLGIGPIQDFNMAKGADIFIVPAFGGAPVKLVENGAYPAWSPDGRNIVFQSDRGGEYDLWIVSAGGGTPTALTADEDYDYHPDWSPDGEWIVYGTGAYPVFELACVRAGGGERRLLTDDNFQIVFPAWDSDGRSILFSSSRNGPFNIWKIPFSPGSESLEQPRQVTLGEGPDLGVSIARGGKKAAFTTGHVNLDVWEYEVASGRERMVTIETSFEDLARLSPDGQTLLVTSNRDGVSGLWTYDLNGKVLQRLTPVGVEEMHGSWSPDGKQIAYVQNQDSVSKLLVRDLSTLSPREIDSNAGGLEYPIWSPDGGMISYQKGDKAAYGNVWVYSFATGQTRKITDLETSNTFATWSPDGRFITFQAQRGDVRTIWIQSVDGGDARQITFGSEEHSHPQWSPADPDLILFALNHKNLCTVSVSTGEITHLTDYVAADLVLDYPSWSPDGKKIFYTLSRKTGDLYVLENY